MEENIGWKKCKDFSDKHRKKFEDFIESDDFKKHLQKMLKRGLLSINKIMFFETDNYPLEYKEIINSLQMNGKLDAIVSTNLGLPLFIDFKAEQSDDRYDNETKHKEGNTEYVIEIQSNPNKQTAGWAYHRGVTIIKGKINKEGTAFLYTPIIFTISEKFINEICRDGINFGKYRFTPNKYSTDGFYRSGYIRVPEKDLIQYFP